MSVKYVFVIQCKVTMVIYGCFDSRGKAENFSNNNINLQILKLKIG